MKKLFAFDHCEVIADVKGLAKLGNIVAETLLQTQMFPSLAARETYVADANFASETYVSLFNHPRRHVWK